MKHFKVISGITIKDQKIISKANKTPIFERQGTADGACGPYSLFMSLKILGILTQTDTFSPEKIDQRTSVYKFMKDISKLKGLIFDGTDLRRLYDTINKNLKSKVNVEWSQENDDNLIDFVIQELDENKPTIIGLTFTEGGHWVVAVGYTTNENNKITNLLVLDPSGEEPSFSSWNSIISLSHNKRAKFPYKWITSGYNVSFEEALSLCAK